MSWLSYDILVDVINCLSFRERKRLLCLNSTFTDIIGRWKNVTLRMASFDIGKNNFAQYVEDCLLDDIWKVRDVYRNTSPDLLKRNRGAISESSKVFLDRIFLNGRRVDIGVFDFQTGDAAASKKLDNATRKNFLQHLHNYANLWDTCDIVIVEQQFVNLFGRQRGINIDALKLGEATVMWFLDHFPHLNVVTFGSQYKTQILGAPCKMKKPERKKWATAKALEIFKMRNDEQAMNMYALAERIKRKRLNTEEKIQSFLIDFEGCDSDIWGIANCILRKRQKLDDISDVVVQLQAYKYKVLVCS